MKPDSIGKSLIDFGQFGPFLGLPNPRVPAGQLLLDADHGNGRFSGRSSRDLLRDEGMAALVKAESIGIEQELNHGTSGSASILRRFSAMISITSSKYGSSLNMPANSTHGLAAVLA